MTATTLPGVLLSGTHAARPAASAVASGTLYAETDTGQTYQSDGSSTWTAWGAAAGGSGAITSSAFTMSTARLLGRTTASTGAIEEITVGSGLTLSAGSLTASGSSLSYQQNFLSANVTVTTANTYYDGPSVTLSAGTWYITAHLTVTTGGSGQGTMKIWDGTTVGCATGNWNLNNEPSFHAGCVVVIASGTPTWKASYADQAGGATILATPTNNNSGLTNLGSNIVAIKIA